MSGGNLGKITARKEHLYYAFGYADVNAAPVGMHQSYFFVILFKLC